MDAIGPELRWVVAALLLGLAATIIHFARRQFMLLAAALLIAPLPALVFLRLTNKPLSGAPEDQLAAGLVLSALSCYLAPALGALTAYLLELAGRERTRLPAEPSPDEG